jgi:hypothetical protein
VILLNPHKHTRQYRDERARHGMSFVPEAAISERQPDLPPLRISLGHRNRSADHRLSMRCDQQPFKPPPLVAQTCPARAICNAELISQEKHGASST